MQFLATPAQAAQIDRYMIETLEIPGLLLMEQAATAIFHEIAALFPPCRVLLVAGSGNNGGDAWTAARILLTHGYDVAIGAASLTLPPDADANMRYFSHTSRITLLTPDTLDSFFSRDAAVIVDGLLGTGLSRPASGLYGEIIRRINAHPAKVVSVDIPSGISGETGAGQTAVTADITVTFQYAKPGHLLFPGRSHTGRLVVAKIGPDAGRPPLHLQWADTFSLPPRAADTNKGTYGRLAIFAGSRGMAGAAALAARGALAAGAGLTTVYTCEYVQDVLQHTLSSVTAQAIGGNPAYIAAEGSVLENCQARAYAAGPGLGQHAETLPLLRSIAQSSLPKVLDADGLNLLAADGSLSFGANTVLTPHPKEFSRLSGCSMEDILSSPLDTAGAFAKQHDVILLLKGATTVVSDGTQACLVTAGAPSMAKGGSGDVLTGVIGALLAQGFSPFTAAYGGAYLCGKAGETAAARKGDYAPTAEDTAYFLGR